MKRYSIIYADPAWQYKVFDDSDAAHGAAKSNYNTMIFNSSRFSLWLL